MGISGGLNLDRFGFRPQKRAPLYVPMLTDTRRNRIISSAIGWTFFSRAAIVQWLMSCCTFLRVLALNWSCMVFEHKTKKITLCDLCIIHSLCYNGNICTKTPKHLHTVCLERINNLTFSWDFSQVNTLKSKADHGCRIKLSIFIW